MKNIGYNKKNSRDNGGYIMIKEKDIKALNEFCNKYPTWWYKIGVCSLTRDFDCAPQGNSPEFEYIKKGIWEDDCFSCDSHGSVADAINNVMKQIKVKINETKP